MNNYIKKPFWKHFFGLEQKHILYLMLPGILIGLILVIINKPNAAIKYNSKEYKASVLDKDRQVIWVRYDSLNTLLTSSLNSDKISVTATNSELLFVANEIKDIQNELLQSRSINVCDSLEGEIIKKTANGFSLKIELKNNIRYVQIPAEILQSLQL